MPESVRPAPLPRPEALAPVRPNALASGVQAAPQVETQNRQDRPGQPSAWRERQQQEALVTAPAATGSRIATPPALAPAPQASVLGPQRNERPQPEVVRPVMQTRPEPFETRVQDRPSRRNEPTINPPQSAIRIEPPAQQFRQATPARMETPPPMVRETRHEAPREISRPAEPRAEARTQNQGDRQRQGQNDQEKKRQQRDEAEKR